MIVYNVKRRWFDMKNDADDYRRAESLPPAATAKIEICDRKELAALLNALCEPQAAAVETALAEVVDRAYVDPYVNIPDCVPAFLRKDNRRAA